MSRSHRAVRWLSAVALVALLSAGCSSSSSSPSSASASSGNGDLATFCAAIKSLSSAQLSPAQMSAVHDRIVQSAPDDIAVDATEFATNSRAVSDAFAAAGAATKSSVDTAAILATLTPAQQKFVTDLASASKTGIAPAGSTGRVLTYVNGHC